MKFPRCYILVFAGLLFTACKVGPKYRTPATAMTPTYKENPPDYFKEASVFKEASPQDALLRGEWWQIFGDPSLNELAQQVRVSNQTIAAAEAQYRAARAAIGVARADLFPTVTGGVTVTDSRFPTNRVVGQTGVAGSGTFFQLPLQTSYEADLWGKVRNNILANKDLAEASAADLESIRLSMIAELAADYFQLRGLDLQEQLLKASVVSYEEALQLTTNRYNQGIVSGVDVAQAQTQLETTRAQLIDLGVARAQFEHAIAVLTGKAPADLTIAAVTNVPEPPAIPVGLPSDLLQRRPDIAAAERRVAAANADIGVAKAAYFPSIILSAAGGTQGPQIANLLSLPNRFWSLGAALAQTIFDAGRRKSTVEGTEANYDQTVAIYRQTVLTAFQQVEDNLAALRILAQEEAQQDLATNAAQRSLDLIVNRYRGGIASYTDVIVAQNTLLTNQRTAILIRTTRMTSSVLLIKALGGVWVK
jgi:NodT family efflux transporter outer membrane factor (OMF) lipoprotein